MNVTEIFSKELEYHTEKTLEITASLFRKKGVHNMFHVAY